MSLRQVVLVLVLLLPASHAYAQEGAGPRRRDSAPPPPPAVLLGDAPDRLTAPAPLPASSEPHSTHASARRPLSRYPLVGAAVGALAGIGYGAYLHSRIEPGTGLAGPPAYVLTVPLGAVAGLLVGIAANAVHPPSGR